MEKLNVGETIILEGEKEFICFHRIEDNGKSYLYMMSNFKPLEVFFAEEITDGEKLCIKKVESPEEKHRLLYLLKESFPAPGKQSPEEPETIKTLDGTIHEEGISRGETVELENYGTYICYKKIQDGGKEYLSLFSKSSPGKFIFAEETCLDGILSVNIITDPILEQRLAQLNRANPWEAIKQLFQRKPKKKR